jgi:hypothetical protein
MALLHMWLSTRSTRRRGREGTPLRHANVGGGEGADTVAAAGRRQWQICSCRLLPALAAHGTHLRLLLVAHATLRGVIQWTTLPVVAWRQHAQVEMLSRAE